MFGAMYAILGLIIGVFFLIFGLIGGAAAGGNGMAAGLGFAAGVIIAAPLIYGVMGLILGAIAGAIYNIVAKVAGGIRMIYGVIGLIFGALAGAVYTPLPSEPQREFWERSSLSEGESRRSICHSLFNNSHSSSVIRLRVLTTARPPTDDLNSLATLPFARHERIWGGSRGTSGEGLLVNLSISPTSFSRSADAIFGRAKGEHMTPLMTPLPSEPQRVILGEVEPKRGRGP